ncbi:MULTISPECIES: DNA cytosine methyltransferase [unclassified Streptomyces]|uniref:DNA cytosine methyltransferase n=1 Tax=unclassified Streptomyces TaxID=2593676 RepID=UPI00224FAAC0|nr:MULTISPECIES: DNA cytosine methyltransferase [unclassified Streptomyces]MCX4989484.1 DNA cytosine methyltransferase [Streptomyces sp. NBC_00568]MCX5005276.1 DNA cytosine methyltransferase [Streptomyces sp. NBC_00638]
MNARMLPLRRPNGLRLLDLCSGAGGLSMGYYLAGFDVVGVDIAPMPNYPFPFIQADGLDYCADHGHEYDLVHGSWPCERYATVTKWRGKPENHPDLIGPGRQVMQATGRPWVIENVPETAAAGLLRPDYLLCGTAFGLSIRRHRVFETSWRGGGDLVAPCWHRKSLLAFEHKGERAYADAMGCTWMTSLEARKAVPPAYAQWIAEQFLTAERRVAA